MPRGTGRRGGPQRGNALGEHRERLLHLQARERCAEAEVDAGAERDVRVGVAARRRTSRRRRRPRGRGSPSRAAPRSSGPRAIVDPSRPRRRQSPCARTAARGCRSAASPRPRSRASPHGSCDDARPTGRGRASSATRPLPKPLTVASCPALSSRTTVAASSRLGEPFALGLDLGQVGDEVVAGLGATALEPARRRTPRTRGRQPGRDASSSAVRSYSYILHDGLRPRAQRADSTPARRGGRRSRAPAAARRSRRWRRTCRSRPSLRRAAVEQLGAQLLDARPRGPRCCRARTPVATRRLQPRVLRRLVLEQRVLVQPVEGLPHRRRARAAGRCARGERSRSTALASRSGRRATCPARRPRPARPTARMRAKAG